MRTIDIFHLPGLADRDVERFDTRTVNGTVELRHPVLRPGSLGRIAQRLKAAREHTLLATGSGRIVEALAAAAARLVEPGPNRELILQALPAVANMSPGMAALILDGMARDWTADALHALLDAEFGGSALLDGFVPHGPVRSRALGPPLICHILAGNVPGTGVTSIIRATLVRSASLAKSSTGEPLLAPLFAHALREVDPPLADCIAVAWWPGSDDAAVAAALAEADTAVVYGGAATIAAIRARAPAHVRLVEHGPKVSIGIVGADALSGIAAADSLARDVARAVATFDQHGCVSPQVVWVERGATVSPRAFAERVAAALDAIGQELPRGTLTHADAAALRELIAAAEFRVPTDPGDAVLAVTDATVIYDEDRPVFEGSCLNRTLRIKAIDSIFAVPPQLVTLRDVLQSAALAGVDPRRAELLGAALAAAGLTRITTFPRLPWPPGTWHHDGRGPLRELVRFVDLESSPPDRLS